MTICSASAAVPRFQVRVVRGATSITADSRASSRASAAKAFTTALAPMASAMAPPSFVSQALDKRAAGQPSGATAQR